MSDFVSRDSLPELWDEILRRHWTYLDTEESMQKLEERKKLEGCLKEFLRIVPHDRKFFLPETAQVLKESIKQMDDFSAYKAMIGFESISQYANNLFTKPWRKEYRVIKMYSGFYQHEIKSNLIDADKLFEAMGYKQLPNQVLMLDGPICPDQVTNVSRDAMAAYVECQIMKQIFSGLTSMQLSCSWVDILNFREAHIGGASQAIKSMGYAIQERRFRKEKFNSENCYATMQQVQSCPSCAHQYHQQSTQIGNSCNHHHIAQQQQQPYISGICSIHPQPPQNIYVANNVPVTHYKQSNYGPPQMSHSKSLEHYGEHASTTGILPHRHSFDQPYDNSRVQYDVGAYDCVDGYQSCNFNAYNHPYNVSGNRYPLPYTISNQLNNQFPGSCSISSTGHYSNTPPQPAQGAIAGCGHKIQMPDPNCYKQLPADQLYGECNGFSKKSQDICNHYNGKDLINYRPCNYIPNGRPSSVRTEQLIDFDDRPGDNIPTTTHNIQPHPSRSHNSSFDYNDRIYDQTALRQHRIKHQAQQQYDTSKPHINITQTPKDLYNRNYENSDEIDGNFIYSGPRSEKKLSSKTKSSDKCMRNAQILGKYVEQTRDNVRDSSDSYEEVVAGSNVDTSDSPPRSKSISNKNQDGVGSFESWNYVFQNLEHQGYTKDLGERGDLLVQGLDLDSRNLPNSAEKRRSRNMETKLRTPGGSTSATAPNTSAINNLDNVKSKTLEKTTDLIKDTNIKSKALEKSILKHDNETVQKTITKTTQVQKSGQPVQKLINTKHQQIIINNNHESNNHAGMNDKRPSSRQNNRQVINRQPSTNGTTTTTTTSGQNHLHNHPKQEQQKHVSGGNSSTSAVICSPNEWSCRFCTYLNPDTKRICEICGKTKDFIDASNPPTSV